MQDAELYQFLSSHRDVDLDSISDRHERERQRCYRAADKLIAKQDTLICCLAATTDADDRRMIEMELAVVADELKQTADRIMAARSINPKAECNLDC